MEGIAEHNEVDQIRMHVSFKEEIMEDLFIDYVREVDQTGVHWVKNTTKESEDSFKLGESL